MNRPKTNTYHEHYSISDDDIILITIGPKPWYSVFAAKVDITILTTYDIVPKPSTNVSQVEFCTSEIGSVTWVRASPGSDFRNTQIG